jgi:hypothetical protein
MGVGLTWSQAANDKSTPMNSVIKIQVLMLSLIKYLQDRVLKIE